MTRCSTGRATQKYSSSGGGADLSSVLTAQGDILYADSNTEAANVSIGSTTGHVLTITSPGELGWQAVSGAAGSVGTLQAVTTAGPTTDKTIQFQNTTTSLSASGNVLVTGNVGIGTNTPDANLHVTGNAFISSNLALGGVLSMGIVNVVARHTLSAITATGNLTPYTVIFDHPTTAFVTTANVEVGDALTVSGNVAVDTDTLVVDSVNDRVGIGTASPGYDLDVLGDINFSGEIRKGGAIQTFGGGGGGSGTTPSDVTRITNLEYSNIGIWSNLASNVDRIEALETSNVDIWSNLASNVDRIEALETSNVDIWSNLASNVDRIEALETSNVDIWSNLASNVDRIEALETSNVDIWSNLASNVIRIAALETNGIISNSSGITSIIQGDIVYASADSTLSTLSLGAANRVLKSDGTTVVWGADDGGSGSGTSPADVTRIANLEYSNIAIWSNLASNVDRIEALETSNVGIWSNLASNVDRIEALETSNVDIWSNLASNVIRIAALETNGIISNSSTITSISQGDLIYASADSTLQTLTVSATAGHVLKVSAGGVPVWDS